MMVCTHVAIPLFIEKNEKIDISFIDFMQESYDKTELEKNPPIIYSQNADILIIVFKQTEEDIFRQFEGKQNFFSENRTFFIRCNRSKLA